MPAKSRSQQRLMGMLHAYNSGRFHGPKSLERRLAAMSSRMSDEDARHFAETPHAGLPESVSEKSAQYVAGDISSLARNLDLRRAGQFVGRYADDDDDDRRGGRGVFGTAVHDAAVGSALGALVLGGGGAAIGKGAATAGGMSQPDASNAIWGTAARLGAKGALGGAVLGGIVGLIRGVIGNLRR